MNGFSSSPETNNPTRQPLLYRAPLGDPGSIPPPPAELRKMISNCKDKHPPEAPDDEEKE